MTEHIVRISGQRIGHMLEKPWIFVTPGQEPDGSLREYKRGKVAYAGASERWNAIGKASLAEADRVGRDGRGNRPVSGEYLESLSNLEMPPGIEDTQRAGSQRFGVVDVVVIWGKGGRDGPETPMLTRVTPVKLPGYDMNASGALSSKAFGNMSQDLETLSIQTPGVSSPAETRSTSRAPIHSSAGRMASDPSDISQMRVGSSPPESHPTTGSLKKRSSSPLTNGSSHDPLMEPFGKKPRTLENQFASISAAATIEAASSSFAPSSMIGLNPSLPRTTRSATLASEVESRASSPLSSLPPETPEREKLPTTKSVGLKPKTPPRDATLPASSPGLANMVTSQPQRSLFARKKGSWHYVPNTGLLDTGFVNNELNEDCRIGYAVDGVVRQVGATRGASFREQGVVMGCRFVVG